MLPILQSLPEGSSGTGISYYSNAVRCPRKAKLDVLHRAAREPGDASPNYRADVGKIFHALCEIYYNTGERSISVELSDINMGEAPDEARRLFSAYTERFNRSDFARVIATELQLPAKEADVAVIASLLGVSPFTCRLDMAVEVAQEHCDVLYRKRGLVLTPGVYLWDFKTKAAKGAGDELVYRHAPQFLAYQAVWNALNPETPCLGMVADCIVAHKKMVDNSFYSILVPAPGPEQIAGLKRFLAYAQKQTELDEPNWLSCFDYGRACPHLTSGACNRA